MLECASQCQAARSSEDDYKIHDFDSRNHHYAVCCFCCKPRPACASVSACFRPRVSPIFSRSFSVVFRAFQSPAGLTSNQGMSTAGRVKSVSRMVSKCWPLRGMLQASGDSRRPWPLQQCKAATKLNCTIFETGDACLSLPPPLSAVRRRSQTPRPRTTRLARAGARACARAY